MILKELAIYVSWLWCFNGFQIFLNCVVLFHFGHKFSVESHKKVLILVSFIYSLLTWKTEGKASNFYQEGLYKYKIYGILFCLIGLYSFPRIIVPYAGFYSIRAISLLFFFFSFFNWMVVFTEIAHFMFAELHWEQGNAWEVRAGSFCLNNFLSMALCEFRKLILTISLVDIYISFSWSWWRFHE